MRKDMKNNLKALESFAFTTEEKEIMDREMIEEAVNSLIAEEYEAENRSLIQVGVYGV